MAQFECEVAVIGAGPYGLSVAAHLKEANIESRVFGETMSFWRNHMPAAMKLRSSPTATDLADPKDSFTFHAFAADHEFKPTWPVPRTTFVSYGEWFEKKAVAEHDNRTVTGIDPLEEGFRLHLSDGCATTSQRVVVATGLAKQEFRPAVFSTLPREHVSFSGEHPDMSIFRGKRVAVIGRGQCACENAGFLNDAGAEVELVSRGNIRWLGSETPFAKPDSLKKHLHQMLATKSGVGPFPFNWLAEHPGAVRRIPDELRATFSTRCLRPGATSWIRPSLAGVKMRLAGNIVGATSDRTKIALRFDEGSAEYDHVLLATGYRSDISKLGLLSPALLERVHRVDGSPTLSAGFESSVQGLHFIGSSSVMSYGPLMRFVSGSNYTARHFTRSLVAQRVARTRIKSRHKTTAAASTDKLTTFVKSKYARMLGS